MAIMRVPDSAEWGRHDDRAPHTVAHTLTISDVERLAKAGVTISYGEIATRIRSDAPQRERRTLSDAFWERWDRAHDSGNELRFNGVMRPYGIAAHQHGDKVTVFVAPYNKEPFLLHDEKVLYPSDALMAKLALWEQTDGKN